MSQKKNLFVGAIAFVAPVAVGLIVGLPLLEKASSPDPAKVILPQIDSKESATEAIATDQPVIKVLTPQVETAPTAPLQDAIVQDEVQPIDAAEHAPHLDGTNEENAHWGYSGETGPEHWGNLSRKFTTCKSGMMQSPIDLEAANTSTEITVNTDYKPLEANIRNTGHSIQIDVNNGSVLHAHDKAYKLLQVHFHTPSEHVTSGRTYPLEAHFVHASDNGELAVLGVLYEIGKKNAVLNDVVDLIEQPLDPETTKAPLIDLNRLMPNSRTVIRYMGSLTTPPCSEGVNWYVLAETQTASMAQIAKLHTAVGDNNRPPQPTNNRLIIKPAQ